MAVITGDQGGLIDFAVRPLSVEWLQGIKALVPIDFTRDSRAVSISSWNFRFHVEAAIASYRDGGDIESVKRLPDPQPVLAPPRIIFTSTVGMVFMEIPENFYMVEVDYAQTTKIPCAVVTLQIDTGPGDTDPTNALRFLIIVRRGIS